jgi:hypothetical protein
MQTKRNGRPDVTGMFGARSSICCQRLQKHVSTKPGMRCAPALLKAKTYSGALRWTEACTDRVCHCSKLQPYPCPHHAKIHTNPCFYAAIQVKLHQQQPNTCTNNITVNHS